MTKKTNGLVIFFLAITSILITGCDSLWSVKDQSTINFSLDLNQFFDEDTDMFLSLMSDDADPDDVRIFDATVSLNVAETNEIIQQQVVPINIDDMNISVQFLGLEPNLEIYANITIEDEDELIFSAQSNSHVLQAGPDNILKTFSNAVFIDPTNGLDSNNGFTYYKPVQTMDKALEILKDVDNGTIWVMGLISTNADEIWSAKEGQSITVKRHTNSKNSMVYMSDSTLTLENIIIDGNTNVVSLDGSSRELINVYNNSTLNIGNNVIIQNSRTGAIVVNAGNTVALSGNPIVIGNTNDYEGIDSNIAFSNSTTESPLIVTDKLASSAKIGLSPYDDNANAVIVHAGASHVQNMNVFSFDDGEQKELVIKLDTIRLPSAPTLKISTAQEFESFRNAINSGDHDLDAVLTADINLSSIPNWTPIKEYSGTFDGQGYTISGLTITGDSMDRGLFGYVNGGTVKNLIVKDANVAVSSVSGIVVGKANNSASLVNIGVVGGNLSFTKQSWGGTAGAVVGLLGPTGNVAATVVGCWSTATIQGDPTGALVGGIESGTANESYYIPSGTATINTVPGVSSTTNIQNLNTKITTMNSAAIAADPSIGYKWEMGADINTVPRLVEIP